MDGFFVCQNFIASQNPQLGLMAKPKFYTTKEFGIILKKANEEYITLINFKKYKLVMLILTKNK